MTKQDNRWFPRYAARRDVRTKMKVSRGDCLGSAVDISCGGAYLADVCTEDKTATVSFSVPDMSGDGHHFVRRTCDILPERASNVGGCAIRFHRALTPPELAVLVAESKDYNSVQLAVRDYGDVVSEVHFIQSCRSNIFLGTLAAIATWTMGAIGLVIANKITDATLGTVLGAILPYVMLTIAVLASIEKARAINFRRGFLAAISDYLKANVPPPNYLGWAHLHMTCSECRARMEAGLCPDKINYCWEEERDKHKELTKKKHVISKVLDSFTAFSTLIYGILYAATSVVLITAGLSYLDKIGFYPVPLSLAGGAVLVVMAVVLVRELANLRKGKHSVEAQYLTWRAALRHCRPLGRMTAKLELSQRPQAPVSPAEQVPTEGIPEEQAMPE